MIWSTPSCDMLSFALPTWAVIVGGAAGPSRGGHGEHHRERYESVEPHKYRRHDVHGTQPGHGEDV